MTVARFVHRYNSLRSLVDRRLASVVANDEPRDLMEGSRYVLIAAGKRVRSTLVLLSCRAVGGPIANAIDAAVAIEMLHNFTLVHDDVMDNAPSRRGHATVHMKWDVNNAILVGDVILGLAYRNLLRSKTRNIQRAAKLFTNALIDVCEGQGFDVAFESRRSIHLPDYFRMIGKKTGKLIATAAELGAVLGNGTPPQVRSLRAFGTHIGRAFQIQDDLLDVVADESDFGKQIGGDILEGKKTFLLVQALEQTRGKDRAMLRGLRRKTKRSSRNKRDVVEAVTAIYRRCGAIESARRHVKRETAAGLRALNGLPASESRTMLQWLARMLVQRTS